MKEDVIKILRSWKYRDGLVNSTESLLEWIRLMNQKTVVNIQESSLLPDEYWYFNKETGIVENKNNNFFSIRGVQYFQTDKMIAEQPIIYQPEIGFLGIICKEFDGVMHLLMQGKVEPGNVNGVQISPTIQATKSNFTRAHGGELPKYFSFFENLENYTVIFDQIQSEQGSRFYKKRNRNIMIRVDDDIEVFSNFRWMTLGQIKALMKIDNLVNMDTRTVLSCIPISTYLYTDRELKEISEYISDEALFHSIFRTNIQDGFNQVYTYINDIKMWFNIRTKLVPLYSLSTWVFSDEKIVCNKPANFEVRYYDIEISGREMRRWKQPLVKATGIGTCGLLISEREGELQFLVAVRSEIGAFDTIEIGPTISRGNVHSTRTDYITEMFETRLHAQDRIMYDTLFSEEGGRFYHEQNRNVIMKIDYIKPEFLPKGYFWMSFSSLNSLAQVNNCLNIELRNLLSMIDI